VTAQFQDGTRLTDKEEIMLVLSRKEGQRVVIGEEIEVTVLEVRGSRVKLGFHGPVDVPIHREELHQKIADSEPALHHAECA
jgi:carbon storage regulator